MAKFRGAVLQCEVCGKQFKVPPCRAKKARFCSAECSAKRRMEGLKKPKVEVTCEVCGKVVLTYPCLAATKRFCSYECAYKSPAKREKASAGKKGTNNAMWAGGLSRHCEGYVYEKVYDHPYSNRDYVLQHRLVVERWFRENDPTSKFLITLGCNKYLRPEYIVHHKDLNRANNIIDNLQVVTHKEHQQIHNKIRESSPTLPPTA